VPKLTHQSTRSGKPGQAQKPQGVLLRFWQLLRRLLGWLISPWRPTDPVLLSLQLLKRHGGGGRVPEQQWRQLEQQARTLAKRGERQQAITVLHCLLLLKPGAESVTAQLDRLTAAEHKLSLHSKGISGTTRAYRRQLLDLYVQQGSVQVLEAVARL
jgi:hypothetical protein